jgi:RNA polymerase sigma-70 factor (ECF subfamily)
MPDSPANDWRNWYTRHAPALLLLARHHLPRDAEDALQEGFTQFWRSRHRAQDPVAYLFTCVRNAALAIARKQRTRERRSPASTAERFAPPATPDDRLPLLHAALDRLPADQREVVLLKIWAGLTFAQIASALALSPNTAASRYRFALAHLQTLLSPEAFS